MPHLPYIRLRQLGANYAQGVVPQVEAAEKGYSQNLWLLGKEHWLTEVGTMVSHLRHVAHRAFVV